MLVGTARRAVKQCHAGVWCYLNSNPGDIQRRIKGHYSFASLDNEVKDRIKRVFAGSVHAKCFDGHETSSPPRSMPRPVSTFPIRGRSIPRFGLLALVGGRRESKLSRLLASRAASGVFAVAGVRPHPPAI